MGNKNIGDSTEAIFLIKALEAGWEVASPFGGSHSYDFVIRRSAEMGWETVQVKTAYPSKRHEAQGKLEVGFRRSKGRGSGVQPYKPGDFALLFAGRGQEYWLIPWEEIASKRSSIMVGSQLYDKWRL